MTSVVDVRIEAGGIGDVPRLERLWLELHGHHRIAAPQLGPFVSDETAWAVRRASYEECLGGGAFLLLALSGDRLVGYAMVAIHEPVGSERTDTWLVGNRIAELETLVPDAAVRAGDIGAALLDAAETEIARRDVGVILLRVVPGNAAQRLHERRGHRPTWLTLSRLGSRDDVLTDGPALIERYLALLSDPRAPIEAFRTVLHPEVRQIEHPNALNPAGQERDLQALLDDVTRGRKLLAEQRFDVLDHVASGDRVATRAVWAGTLASGATLTARFSMHFVLRDGLVWRQENFDCFDPLPGGDAAAS
jgi:hypothetical protein